MASHFINWSMSRGWVPQAPPHFKYSQLLQVCCDTEDNKNASQALGYKYCHLAIQYCNKHNTFFPQRSPIHADSHEKPQR